MKRILAASATCGTILTLGMATPAIAAEPKPVPRFPVNVVIYGWNEKSHGCWSLPSGRMPQIEVSVNGSWEQVAAGSPAVPEGYLPGSCPDGYQPVYYNWFVQTWGQPTGESGVSNLEVREAIPDVTTTSTRTYAKRVRTDKCARGVRPYFKRVTRWFDPQGADAPVKATTTVKRCRGEVRRKSTKALKAQVRFTSVQKGVAGQSSVITVMTEQEYARRIAEALCKIFGCPSAGA